MTTSRWMSMKGFAPKRCFVQTKGADQPEGDEGAGNLILAGAAGPTAAAPSGSGSDYSGTACTSDADYTHDADAIIDVCGRVTEDMNFAQGRIVAFHGPG
eukprot:4970008-Pyramimonas_sp.AAC.1